MRVIIFGMGNYYRIQKPKLKTLSDIEIVAFADNNTALWGREEEGYPVIAPEEIISKSFDMVLIVSLYVRDIRAQLLSLGVKKEKIQAWLSFWSDRMQGRIEVFEPETKAVTCKKKILIIAGELDYNGAAMAAVNAADVLLSRGCSVVLAAPAINEKLLRETMNAGITVAVCKALPSLGSVEEAWIGQFDVVLVNSYPMIDAAVAAGKHRSVLWWLHEPQELYPIVRQQYPDDFAEEDILNIRVCAVSEVALQPFGKVFPNVNVTVLPPGVPDRRQKAEDKSRRKKMVFAIIGGVGPAKGQEVFLEAAAKIKAIEEAEFWLIGGISNSEYCMAIREKAESIGSVRIWGVLTREEMDAVFRDIDVVVCASREETLSLAVIEGMMFEKICITTGTTGIAAYIEDGKNGFITEYGDSGQLSEKMEWVLENRDSLTLMKKEAGKTYEKWFSMLAFGKRLEKMLDVTMEEQTGVMV